MITVHAIVHAAPEHREAYLEGLRGLQASTLANDAGCLSYQFYASIDDEHTFVCVEEWTDMEALRAHIEAPHHVAASAALDEFRAGPGELRVFESHPIDL